MYMKEPVSCVINYLESIHGQWPLVASDYCDESGEHQVNTLFLFGFEQCVHHQRK